MLWVLPLVVIVVWVAQKRWLTRRQAALAKQLKTKVRMLPVLGHSYKFLGTDEDRMKAHQTFGRDAIEAGGISKFMNFDQLFICVADPAVADLVLTQCLEKHDLMKIIDFVIGNASIIAEVPIWRHRRKIDAPLFNTKNLVQFSNSFSEQSIVMTNLLEQKAGKGKFSFWEYIEVYSMNTVCETVMGVNINFERSDFLNAIEELWKIKAYRACQPWLRSKFAFRLMPCYKKAIKHKRTVHNFITQIIEEKQKQIREKHYQTDTIKNKTKGSFLDLQLEGTESSRKFSEIELFEETLMLVVAGFDTTATNAAFVVLMLSEHPDVQDKVYEELLQVFGNSDRAATYEDMARLKYLDAVVRETLRLYPPVPVIARHVDKDLELTSDITIVKGCGILVNIWAINRNPEYWGDDADQFRPERFLNHTPKHPAAFMSFSYGPRGCIGYRFAMISVKSVLCTLLRRYRLLPQGAAHAEPLRTKYNMMLRHVDNYQIRLERRN